MADGGKNTGSGQVAPRRVTKAIVSVYNGGGLADRQAQLKRLLALVGDGRLRVPVGWRGPWDRIAEPVQALSGRSLRGKAVLDVL
ncbi:zinc-binding dehydrogenase [Streptomyces sp. STR69]|uniref:zinc-binding dehydrogenase n=1 Tax=Streptomyces sp. STR69 TaxID=1796942 RepID=UPI0021CA6806|nr:zinc-binding dehydrogenase [Streptomyces sp. STR69]